MNPHTIVFACIGTAGLSSGLIQAEVVPMILGMIIIICAALTEVVDE